MKLLTLSIVTALSLWPIVGAAELYKWTDEEGNFHITDAPPPELHKKSDSMVKPSSRSVRPMNATPRLTMPKPSRAKVRPVPEPSLTPHVPTDATRPDMVGLNPNQAILTSAWQTFDESQAIANVPVQRWKDQRGIEHFVDVLPTPRNSAEVGAALSKHRPKTP
jgi:hypothetical protein